MLVADNRVEGDPSVQRSKRPTPVALMTKRAMRRLSSDLLWRGRTNEHYYNPQWNFSVPTVDEIVELTPFTPDVIVAYWVNFFVSDSLLRELSERYRAPIFWYLMDMAPITGGCHYAFDCQGYQGECGNCPAIGSHKEEDVSRSRWLYKDSHLSRTPLLFLAPSSQVIDQLKAGSLSKNRPHALLTYSISSELFAPQPQAQARQRFDAPEDAFIVFFGAQHLQEKRKGMGLLLEALRSLSEMLEPAEREKVFLLYAGSGANLELPFPGKYVGYLDRQGLAQAYQASDVYACPSIEESGPLMINESLMSGRPVVCFEMGVGRDLVHNGETGFRVALGDSDELAKALLTLVRQSPVERQALRDRCRAYALEKLHPHVQARNLVSLGEEYNYEALTKGFASV